jgi:hypothetical protein
MKKFLILPAFVLTAVLVGCEPADPVAPGTTESTTTTVETDTTTPEPVSGDAETTTTTETTTVETDTTDAPVVEETPAP